MFCRLQKEANYSINVLHVPIAVTPRRGFAHALVSSESHNKERMKHPIIHREMRSTVCRIGMFEVSAMGYLMDI